MIRMVTRAVALLLCLIGPATWLSATAVRAGELPQAQPEEVGLDGQQLARIDGLVAQAIEEKKMPGCVVCVGRRGKIAWLKAYGNKRVEPETEPMTVDTLFDMASITKPVATATSVMLLVERGKLQLSDKVVQHLPEFAAEGKESITVHELLTHTSGMLADNAIADYQQGHDEAIRRICALKPLAPVGQRFIYSDVNFILLGEIVSKVSGQNLHEFSRTQLFEPLGMKETGYLPSAELRRRAAPTEKRDGQWIQGEVHDPRAFKLGGIAGHAGLFSTASDMAVYAQRMLEGGRGGTKSVLAQPTIATMTRGYQVPNGWRGLGWDKRTGFSSNRGEQLSDSAYGHGGFTGTVLWIDPELDLFYILLSNRVHPNGKGLVNPLAGRIGSIVASAIR